MKNLISSLQIALENLEKGTISRTEIEQMTNDARELYERLVVLRFKAYEQLTQSSFEKEVSLSADVSNEVQETLIAKEALVETPASGAFDFSLFEEAVVAAPIAETVAPAVAETVAPVAETVVEPVAVETSAPIEMEVATPEVEEHISVTTSEVVIDNQEFEKTQEVHSIVEETPVATTVIETQTTSYEAVAPKEEAVSAPSTGFQSGVHPYVPAIKKVEQNIRGNYSIVPLETLVGSFTLGEKLQFINQLFNGSSEAFSSAIKKLDGLSGMDEARNVVAEIVASNGWDIEGEATEEFLLKVCRRYAATLSV
ncbi:MAG: hypothetical protein RL264_831 [Bacteroidota bacterium]|jgi:hypothetical protein